jgi:hypothetical protein
VTVRPVANRALTVNSNISVLFDTSSLTNGNIVTKDLERDLWELLSAQFFHQPTTV